jgi:hypothetical protein
MGGFSSSASRSGLDPIRIVAVHSDWRSLLARWGLAAKGILYVALGILAINVAMGDAPSGSATSRGAVELVASQPFGQILLGVLTVGLFALALWQLLLALTGDPVEGSGLKHRAKFTGKALVYGAAAMTALSVFMPSLGGLTGGTSGAGGGEGQARATAEIMSWPGGPWLVAILGVSVIAAGLSQLRAHAWRARFMKRLATSRMHGQVKPMVERAGRAGYAARSIVFAMAGGFLIVAAIQHDPQEAIGLSGALQVLSERSWGQAVLWIVAVGVFLYGVFCFAEAKYRRAT